jgi:hypothetical protein
MGHSAAGHWAFGQNVSFHHGHRGVVVSQNTGGHQAGDASPQNDCGFAEFRHTESPSDPFLSADDARGLTADCEGGHHQQDRGEAVQDKLS